MDGFGDSGTNCIFITNVIFLKKSKNRIFLMFILGKKIIFLKVIFCSFAEVFLHVLRSCLLCDLEKPDHLFLVCNFFGIFNCCRGMFMSISIALHVSILMSFCWNSGTQEAKIYLLHFCSFGFPVSSWFSSDS